MSRVPKSRWRTRAVMSVLSLVEKVGCCCESEWMRALALREPLDHASKPWKWCSVWGRNPPAKKRLVATGSSSLRININIDGNVSWTKIYGSMNPS